MCDDYLWKLAGIDPGHAGGIVLMTSTGRVIYKTVMPVYKTGGKKVYNAREIISILKDNNVHACMIEHPMLHPRSGKMAWVSTYKFLGLMEGILTTLNIPYLTVRPQEWQKKILGKMEKGETKQKSIEYALKNAPEIVWKKNRSKKYHDGLTDAYCIAKYGLTKEWKK